MKIGIGIILLSLPLLVSCGKQQKVIFEAESISYKGGDRHWVSDIQRDCSAISESLAAYMKEGWKVVSSSPKEKLVTSNRGKCVGTEYIIEK